VCYFIVALNLTFWYPLSKKKVHENQEMIKKMHQSEG